MRNLQAGQPRPYADSIYEYLVTFEGGSRSTREGWDLPFGTNRMPDPEPPSGQVFSIPPHEEIVARRAHAIKEHIKDLTHHWDYEAGEKPTRPMGTVLKEFEIVEGKPTHTTYRVLIVEPYYD